MAHAGLRPDIPEFVPLRRLIAHTSRKTKMASLRLAPLRSLTRVQIRRKDGSRERDGPKPRRRRTLKPARRRALRRSGPSTYKHVRGPPPDLWRPHRHVYSRYVRGRETAASQQGCNAHVAHVRSGKGADFGPTCLAGKRKNHIVYKVCDKVLRLQLRHINSRWMRQRAPSL